MNKLIAFFTGVFIFGMIFSGIGESGGGVAVALLIDEVTTTDTKIYVTSTENFLDTDYIYVGTEKILYSSLGSDGGGDYFNVAASGRGYDGTTAASYEIGRKVYNQEGNVLNEALGVNISAVSANSGAFAIAQIPIKFFTNCVPNLITMNFSFLQGDMALIGYLFIACSVGFVITLSLAFLQVAAGVIKIFS